MWKLLILLPILISCTVTPDKFVGLTPADCRAYGVHAYDSQTPTGRIVEADFRVNPPPPWKGIDEVCTGETDHKYTWHGCAVAADTDPPEFPAEDHRYRIVYDDKCVAYHEACHAIYETKEETIDYRFRNAMGDKFAACKQKVK